ncbi:MAG: Helicase associated domain protein, partial [Candidatus Brocadiales bacterium]|nr:Helicase associated domain protein [Candidatus Brocadiales bacterium]
MCTNQKDMGVDGVYKTTSGTFNAYQAKFRTGRPSLTWREISTFMGLTDSVNQRVLFTNCNDMPSVINDRTGFHCIRGNDLDRLDKNDFETILKWLQSGDVEVERKTPLPHQADAIKDILNTLKDDDRATSLMACGTGKTLVALWVTERMDCQNILVLLPSLTLVRQTLHEWLRETEWQHLSYLCVCSDPTVASRELDGIKVNQSDLDFAVTTECNTVNQFLSQDPNGVKIVFSTYQSAHIVAEGMDNNYLFDLGIFDEAHKTAGREGKKFGFALRDDNLCIKKRLFLTATPRHYNLNKRNKEGDLDIVYSMDDPDVYGKIAHELSFAKAARQDIICNYKVIISVVTSEQVSKELLKRGEVLINGDVINAQLVANQIAFKEAIGKYNIKRIFTFHKSVTTAQSFTGKGAEGINTHLPGFNTFHVNGTMSTASRESVINEFRNADSSVISNARCLTEGVDLPSVDMIAFMSPKKSKIDIVQATGRAMRKDPNNPDKIYGYILVPLYLEITTGENIEDAVDKADFGEVWNVLQALQEQDEMLADIIRQMQEDKGKGGDQEDDGFGDIVDIIGVDISLNTLQESITAACIDKLGFTWDMRYGQLLKYKEQFGHCNIPNHYPENKQLTGWTTNQRSNYQKGILSDDRIKRLEDIDFVWEPLESNWKEMFDALREYKKDHGDCNVPSTWMKNEELSRWVATQRNRYKSGKVSKKRIEQMEDLDFEWEPNKSIWEMMFNILQKYKENYGDCNVPQRWQENKVLAEWVSTQRGQYRNKTLSKERIKRLNDIGFEWKLISYTPTRVPWDEMFDALIEYRKRHGDCNIPSRSTENKKLGSWVKEQRSSYRRGILSEERIKRLNDIGFEWVRISHTSSRASWEKMFAELKEYRNKHGDCNITANYRVNNLSLGNWVQRQRQKYKIKQLSEDQIKRLEDTGVKWSLKVSKLPWDEMFAELEKYKENYGNCNVPSSWQENKVLASWVVRQRKKFRNDKLSDDCIELLEYIGFMWNPHEANWEEMFDALIEYKKDHGDCNVPSTWKENKQLARWTT